MTTEFSLKGDVSGIVAKLKTLGPKLQKKGLHAALRKGAAIVRKAAVMRARQFDRAETPANISREIVTRTSAKSRKRAGADAIVQVGVAGGAKQYVDNRANRRAARVGLRYEGPGKVFYWRFLEFGTSKMPAQPFMRPALENNIDSVTTAVVTDLNTQIAKLSKGGT